jgi:arsenate reductase
MPECTDGTKTGEFSNGTFGEFTSGTHIMCCFSAPAYSAGAKPATRVNVSAIAVLDELGNPTSEFRTKDWNDFSGDARAKMDFVITLCDAAAGEICPVWLGRPLAAHWGIPDPAAVRGTEAEKRTAFLQCYRQLSARITTFVNLDLAKLAKPALRARLAAIGAMEGATEKALGTEVN